MINFRNNKGFSLIEMIVASIILSLAVVAVCAVSTKSMTAVRSNRDYEIAWDLLDRQLTMIDYFGIEEFINQGQMSGHFGDEDREGKHYWSAKCEEGEYDYLYNLELTVMWGPENAPSSISVLTVLNGTGSEIEENEESEGSSEGQPATGGR
ncbi:MAG: prepilin-type N-terminal cleavage/methylation domain-containing protein [Planctomycetes bacterium]|nr:prepilin-type N-terminal cleavage/methylation domain-containing protein [Planctomycetota bacterium]